MKHATYPKLLILEKQMIVAADLSIQFSKLGYQVLGINSCLEDALEAIGKKRPDFVVVSIEFNGKSDGIGIAKSISTMFNIPIIFISSTKDRMVFLEAAKVDPYALIAKPFDQVELRRGISTAMRRLNAERRFFGRSVIS